MTAKKFAEENAKQGQQRYVNRYNLRSRTKTFEVGDTVIILKRDSTNHLFSRWTGPAKIRRKLSDNSYDVETTEGGVRRLHANHLRPFHERVGAVGIVYETDEEFGEIEYTPLVSAQSKREGREGWLKTVNLEHLDKDQKKAISGILERHYEVYSDKPGLCNSKIARHKIMIATKPTDWPKQPKLHRVPPVFRAEVDRQIAELLREGLIEPSNSPISHPIVCVLKSDRSSVRLCCDNRFINSLSVPDNFPMRQIDDILDRVGVSKFITGLDCTSGYWQIEVEEDSRPYTSFVTHSGSWQWKRPNFGLRNAAATYQRAMEKILIPHPHYATAYIDDISVFSMEWEEHLEHLNAVLGTIETSGFKLRLSKCKFAQKQIALLEQIVGNGNAESTQER